ncbi:MAG: hypothetical protein M3546_16880 [Actinomycetota bacterium]|nr:hypothetical protein [Actinomycetota bacterium]
MGTDTKCAETGLAAVREVRRLCAQGQADLDLRRRDDAMAAFKSALEKNPNADCAQDGVEESDRFWILRAIVWTVGATPDLLVGAGLLFAFFFMLLLTAYIPGVYPVLSRAPLARGVLSARLSLAPLDDKATKLDVGTAMAAQIKERLQRFREEALRGRQPDYELDIGSAGEEFVDLVSSDSGLQDALGKARELSEQTKTIGAIVGLLQAALPIPKLVVTGVLGPPDRNGVDSTLSLEHNGRLAAAATLSGPALDHDPTASDYLRVAQPCAVWVQYEIARVLTRGQIEPDAAESYVHVREGLDQYLAGQEDAARVAYEQAVLLNPQNWAAHVNLAVLEARLSGNFPRSIQIGEEAWEEMRAIGSPTTEKQAAYLAEAHYYRLGYQLAAQYANWLLSLDIPPEQRPSRNDAERALEVAAQVAAEARLMIDWYDGRDRGHRWWKPFGTRALLSKEKRLRRFLVCTVEPSAELVRAGLLVAPFGDPEAAERHAAPIRDRAADPDDLSYRALYNLACYEVTRGQINLDWPDDPLLLALEHLAVAFKRTRGRPRTEIARWARSDPALGPLQQTEPYATVLEGLIARYEPRDVPAPPVGRAT